MEFNSCSYEQEVLIGELNQGYQLARQLKAQMSAEILAGQTQGMLAERIYSCFEKALLILKWGSGSMEQSQQHMVPSTLMPESPLSVIGSPKSEEFNPGCHVQQDSRKSPKRKMMPTWTEQVRTSSENAVEGAPEDAYSWRKYGQKDILGAKYPRSYYRCTYRNIQGCSATKQVQRNDEDPLVFDITYKGTHSCTVTPPRSKSAPTSPQKQEHNNQNNISIIQYQPPFQQPDIMLNLQTGLRVDIQDLPSHETGFLFPTRGSEYENNTLITPSILHESQPQNSLTQSYIPSPATSESTYFSMSPCNMNSFGGVHVRQHSESDITEIISAVTSGTNSPIIGIDIPLDQWELDPTHFLSDNQAFANSFSQAKK